MRDPQFRRAMADGGFTLDSQTGEVNELAGFAGPFSTRARQIGKNIERYEAAWRDTHPSEEPGPNLLRTWDRRAWSETRPDKVVPTDGTVLTGRWIDELHRLGFRSPTHPAALHAARTGALERDAAVNTVLSRLGAKRSAWNAADIRGQVELLISSKGMIGDPSVRRLSDHHPGEELVVAGSIARRPTGKWRARYRDETEHEHTRHFDRKVNAQQWLDQVTAAVVTGTYADPKSGQITFAAFYGEWSARQVWAPGTVLAMSLAARSVPFGNRAMRQIRRSDAEVWIKSMGAAGLAPGTIKSRYVNVRSVFRAAVRDRVIGTEPH